MSQSKYFREELAFLKEQGKEFTEIYPQLARFLHGNTTDPDVERLLEGFAFLSAKLRQKVEDEFPELTHSLINMLWPNYLRPVPSVCILAFTTSDTISEHHVIKRGTEVESNEVLDTKCKFKTCRDVDIYPLKSTGIYTTHSRETSCISIDFLIDGKLNLGQIGLDKLQLYLGGDSYSAQMLYLWLNHYLSSISVKIKRDTYPIPNKLLSVTGFNENESLIPYPKNVYEGYRILQEYLYFSEAFHFFDISGLNNLLPKEAEGKFTLTFEFSKILPGDIRINNESFQLYCTPIINLFEHTADPIDFSGRKPEYAVVPSSRFPSHYETFSVNKVVGWRDDSDKREKVRGAKRTYTSFEGFQHEVERANNRKSLYYRTRLKDSIRGDGFDTFLSFVRGDETESVDVNEMISVSLTCTNRLLPLELGIGDICDYSANTPDFVKFRNITEPTHSLRPILDGSLHWILISNLSLNYLSLLSKDALCSVLRAYDFRAFVDRQAERVAAQRLDAISEIKTEPVDKVLRGMPVRGLQSTIYIDQQGFASEGDLYLFGTVLSHFFALYASINSFHELVVVNRTNGEKYSWGIQTGIQPLI